MTAPVPPQHDAQSFGARIAGALRLDAAVYDEVEHDPRALGQAVMLVVIAAVAVGVGAGSEGAGIVGAIVGNLLGWLVSAVFVWLVGVHWLQHTSDLPELLRTTGFASAPQLVAVLGVVPVVGGLALLASALWGLAAYVVAVREALDVETGRAIAVCLLALALRLLITLALAALAGLLLAAA